MWQTKSGGDQERLVLWRGLDLRDGGRGDFPVGLIFIAFGEWPPIHQWMRRAGQVGESFGRPGHSGRCTPDLEFAFLVDGLD